MKTHTRKRATHEYVSYVGGTIPVQVLIVVYRSEAVFFSAAIWPRDVKNCVGVKLMQLVPVIVVSRHNIIRKLKLRGNCLFSEFGHTIK